MHQLQIEQLAGFIDEVIGDDHLEGFSGWGATRWEGYGGFVDVGVVSGRRGGDWGGGYADTCMR